ncbi:MAG: muconolactone Delta-isomerase family protein [Mycobacterium sp.]|nr:muconolactone Delta-isomerase family protein [Mycobacterium sp.]
MDFLVEMTTHVPAGTSPQNLEDVRAREATRARELASAGQLLRLWRPPLAPGEWRTLGLFAAQDADQLEQKLASMPLRIWRTDRVTPLAPHPNDPGRISAPSEFLTTLTITVPEGSDAIEVAGRKTRETVRARELAGLGRLVRLWTPPNPPGVWRTVGLWGAADLDDLTSILRSLPLYEWMTVEATSLSVHPSDPANGGA